MDSVELSVVISGTEVEVVISTANVLASVEEVIVVVFGCVKVDDSVDDENSTDVTNAVVSGVLVGGLDAVVEGSIKAVVSTDVPACDVVDSVEASVDVPCTS